MMAQWNTSFHGAPQGTPHSHAACNKEVYVHLTETTTVRLHNTTTITLHSHPHCLIWLRRPEQDFIIPPLRYTVTHTAPFDRDDHSKTSCHHYYATQSPTLPHLTETTTARLHNATTITLHSHPHCPIWMRRPQKDFIMPPLLRYTVTHTAPSEWDDHSKTS